MNEKLKFSKLRLPASKRSKSHSQITKFFAQSDTDGVKSDDDSNNVPDYQTLSLPDPARRSPLISEDPKPSFEFVSAKIPKQPRVESFSSGSSSTRSTIKEFFNKSAGENDFEVVQKDIKKAANLKKSTSTVAPKKRKAKPNGISKRQPTIKNALLQREQLFSEIIAEQSLAEHVDPNELQMALALSRSEIETCRAEGADDTEDGSSNSTEGIRSKLEEFGYKVNRNFNDNLSLYITGKKRAKWANKFTSLTMRNENRQQEKITKKIEIFLQNQYKHVNDHNAINSSFIIMSKLLSSMQPQQSTYLRLSSDYEASQIMEFYVNEIFQPTTTKIGHLLKDFRNIPGRDLTPTKSNEHKEEMSDTEMISPDTEEFVPVVSNREDTPPQCFNRETSPDLFEDSEIEEMYEVEPAPSVQGGSMELLVLSSSNSEQITDRNGEICAINRSESTSTPLIVDKAASRTSNQAVETVSILSSSNSNDVETYEKFSSDEVKASNRSSIWNQDLSYTAQTLHDIQSKNNLIDLTQEINELDTSQNHEGQLSQMLPSADAISINLYEIENLSQDSSDDIIILSDDEVNYSIKVLNGMNTSEISTNHSNTSIESKGVDIQLDSAAETKNNSNHDYALAGPSYLHDFEPFDDNDVQNRSVKAFEAVSKFNTSKNSINNSNLFENEISVNYKLAHEIMSDSFLEGNEKADIRNETLPRTKTEEILYLDLTQPSPPPSAIYTAEPYLDLADDNNKFHNIDLSPVKYRKSHSDSLLLPKSTPKSIKRFSSNKKFSEFVADDDSEFSDFDEIDRLVAGSPSKKIKQISSSLQGLDRLLTGEINKSKANDTFEEFIIENKTYLVRTENVKPKPEYDRMDSPTRLKELYKYGLKPLNRKKAVIMLEFIYNQTHPYLVADTATDSEDEDCQYEQRVQQHAKIINNDEKQQHQVNISGKNNAFNLKDCLGACLLKEDGLRFELADEQVIFQTNIRVKICTALLPLHLAWFNLIKSNEQLREAVLNYEPIDLQEIYIFFKSIGCRYDPKDLKRFFDGRGIIFQYDLNKDGVSRHVRKASRQASQKSPKKPR